MITQQTPPNADFINTATLQDLGGQYHFVMNLIEKFDSDPDIRALLARRGLEAGDLAEGVELHKAALAAYSTCQATLHAQQLAGAEYDCIYAAARQAFMEYRAASLPMVKDGFRRFELGLEGRLPEEPDKFLAIARSGYQVAYHTPAYLSLLKKSSVGLNLLETGCTSLEALVAARNAYEAAKAVAIDATIEYELAVARLKDWARRFRRLAIAALKDRPDLQQKLG